jgi:methionine-rich copper-binding protein CopC
MTPRYLSVMLLLLAAAAPPGQPLALTGAAPSADSISSGSPQVVELTFNHPVLPHRSRIVVRDAKGHRVDRKDTHSIDDAAHLAVDLPRLLPGLYKVTWTADPPHAEALSGRFDFTVEP